MTLRRKAILIVSLIVGLQLALLHIVFTHTLIEGFAGIEQASVSRDLTRVKRAVNVVVDALTSKTSDWAFWDDTYEFLLKGGDEYIKSNLDPSSMQALDVDHILIFDRQGKLFLSRSIPPDASSYTEVPGEILDEFRSRSEFLQGVHDRDGHSGIMTAGSQVILFAAYPVLTSERTGPSAGTLIFAQTLSAARVQAIATTAAVHLSALPVSKASSRPGFQDFLRSGLETRVVEVSENENYGYGRISDVDGRPALVFRISESREVLQQGLLTGRTINTMLGLTGLAGLLLTLLAIDQIVIRRLARMSTFMQRLTRDSDLTRRLDLGTSGKDELQLVASEINNMLEALSKAQIELARTGEQALSASQAKSEFMANMSHEIRTPMNGIVGLTELMLDTKLDADQRGCLEMINSSSQRMLAIINDILDFSRIEAGKVDLAPQQINFGAFIDEFIRFMGTTAATKGVEIFPHISPEIPKMLVVDGHRLGQILSNLIGNATKFTRKGGFVMVFAELKEYLGDMMTIQFSVADTGIGISTDKHKQIFEAFTQADGSITRDFGGTGLGLTISKQLVALMGGEIWMQSIPDVGSVFHFTVRCHAAPRNDVVKQDIGSSSDEAREIDISGAKILLVEDNPINQTVALRMLRAAGYDVTLAEDGRQALNALDGQCNNFSLILMDCQMPIMSGFEATRIIRQREREYGTHIPIVAMTANAMEGDRERCLGVGMDNYISKPVSRADLLQLVKSHLRVPGAAAKKLPDDESNVTP